MFPGPESDRGMKPKVLAVIPARLGSRRFSGKVLYPFKGKPLLFYVWDEMRKSKRVDRLVIATDSQEVKSAAEGFGAEVVLSKKSHPSGSDRVAEIAHKLGGEIIINIQADNLTLPAKVIDRGVALLQNKRSLLYATTASRIVDEDELYNPNTVKVVGSRDGLALWFSRYPIPFLQHPELTERLDQYKYLKHIGVYFFRRKGLEAFARWKPSPLEKMESLEQLRILEHSGRIGLFESNVLSISIDTPDDIRKLELV